MSVAYTISRQDWEEDGERSDTLYQCPLCGIAYDIDENPEWGPHGLSNDEYGDWIGLRWGHHVTDNCECHDEYLLADADKTPIIEALQETIKSLVL